MRFFVFPRNAHVLARSVKCKDDLLSVFPIIQAEPEVTNKRVTLVGLNSVLHQLECSKYLAAVNCLEWPTETTEDDNTFAEVAHSPVICSVDRCPCVGSDSSIYVPLPKMIRKTAGIRDRDAEISVSIKISSSLFFLSVRPVFLLIEGYSKLYQCGAM